MPRATGRASARPRQPGAALEPVRPAQLHALVRELRSCFRTAGSHGNVAATRLVGRCCYLRARGIRPGTAAVASTDIEAFIRRVFADTGAVAALEPAGDELVVTAHSLQRFDGLVDDALARWAGPYPEQSLLDALITANAETAADQRANGSFFTPCDVTTYVARSTLLPWLCIAAGADARDLDARITANDGLGSLAERTFADRPDSTRAALARVRVLDPTCGAGSFLVAAAQLASMVGELVGLAPSAQPYFGVDRSACAVEACRLRLLLAVHPGTDIDVSQVARCAAALARQVVVADATVRGALVQADVVVGNPPFVRSRGPFDDARCASVGNVAAIVAERALHSLAPDGRIGLVLPISAVCADAFEPLRELWREQCGATWVSSFDAVPSTLFPGTVQRVCMLLGARDERQGTWHTTRYHRWRARERSGLLDGLQYVPLPEQSIAGSLAKVGSDRERDLLARLFAHAPLGDLLARGGTGGNRFWYRRRWSYYLFFADFVPEVRDSLGALRAPSEYKAVDVAPHLDAHVVLAALSSSLFYWYFTVFSDNRNVNVREIAAFPFDVPAPSIAARLAELAHELMHELQVHSELRSCTYRSVGTISNQYFFQAQTKHVVDRIDGVLAEHYGLDDGQLAFVRAVDAGYRQPRAARVSAAAR